MGTDRSRRTLRAGMRGEDVRALQQALNELGYGALCGAADGIFGPRTQAAVTAFQRDNSLETDGIAGRHTFASLDAALKNIQQPDGARLERFLEYLDAQTGHIYVWGGDGEVMNEARIRRMETSGKNIQRALALLNKRIAQGITPVLGYDCSGLISRFLEDEGLAPSKRNSAHLYRMSDKLTREQLLPGDLVFRHNGMRIYHVGVYIGAGTVIESKGRDDGVVKRGIDASGNLYWNRYGRLKVLYE